MPYRGAKGQPFYLGFQNGDPLKFTVGEVMNAADVAQGLFSAKARTRVILKATLSTEDVERIRTTVTSDQVDAFRIILSGGAQVEKAVSTSNGAKLRQKFDCFYRALSASSAVAASPELAAVAGTYHRKGKPADALELHADGSFIVREGRQVETGEYELNGSALTLVIGKRRIPGSTITGNTIKDNDGYVWERAALSPVAPQPDQSQHGPAGPTATVDEIVDMAKAKVSDDLIILSIQRANSKYELTPQLLIRLKTAGVSDSVIRVMARSGMP
jgi:hypothetical protein